MENLVNQFYELVKISPIEYNEKLKQFNNQDLEELMNENGNFENFDLNSLLVDK